MVTTNHQIRNNKNLKKSTQQAEDYAAWEKCDIQVEKRIIKKTWVLVPSNAVPIFFTTTLKKTGSKNLKDYWRLCGRVSQKKTLVYRQKYFHNLGKINEIK